MQAMTEPQPITAANPDINVTTCKTLSIFVFLILVVIGGVAANIGHTRDKELGVDLTALGVWCGAAAVCLVVGVCAAAICRQLRALGQ